MNDLAKNLILWVVIALVLMTVFNNFGPKTTGSQSLNYSDFISEVQQGRIQLVPSGRAPSVVNMQKVASGLAASRVRSKLAR